MTQYYRERKTMTKWHIIGDTFEPVGPWNIKRDPEDVLNEGIFEGPFNEKDNNNETT